MVPFHWRGVGEYSRELYMGRFRPEVQLLTLLGFILTAKVPLAALSFNFFLKKVLLLYIQYRSKVSYHSLARRESRLARRDSRLSRRDSRLSRQDSRLSRRLVSRDETFVSREL